MILRLLLAGNYSVGHIEGSGFAHFPFRVALALYLFGRLPYIVVALVAYVGWRLLPSIWLHSMGPFSASRRLVLIGSAVIYLVIVFIGLPEWRWAGMNGLLPPPMRTTVILLIPSLPLTVGLGWWWLDRRRHRSGQLTTA
jgi:hypothetical protein